MHPEANLAPNMRKNPPKNATCAGAPRAIVNDDDADADINPPITALHTKNT